MSIDLDPKSPERWVRVGRLMDPGTQSTVEQVVKEKGIYSHGGLRIRWALTREWSFINLMCDLMQSR